MGGKKQPVMLAAADATGADCKADCILDQAGDLHYVTDYLSLTSTAMRCGRRRDTKYDKEG